MPPHCPARAPANVPPPPYAKTTPPARMATLPAHAPAELGVRLPVAGPPVGPPLTRASAGGCHFRHHRAALAAALTAAATFAAATLAALALAAAAEPAASTRRPPALPPHPRRRRPRRCLHPRRRCRRRRRRRRRPGIPGGARRRPGVLTTRWRGLTCSAMHLTHTNVNGVLFFQYCAVLNKKVCLKGNFRRPSAVRNVVLAVYAPTGRYIVESGAVCIYLVGRCTCLQTERYPSTNWHRKLTEFHCPDLIKCGYCPLFNTPVSIYT